MRKSITKLQLVQSPVSPLARLVEDYLADCRASGLSPKTIRFGYGWPLHQVFLPWALDNGITAVSDLTSPQLNHLSAALLDRGLKKSTVWTYMKAIKRFLAWAEEQGEQVSAKAKLPKLDQRLVQVLSREEVNKLEATAATERDKIMVRLLASTGMRREELVTLQVRDLFEEGQMYWLMIHGKGGRDRKVGIESKLARRMRAYSNGRPKTSRLFVALRRRDSLYEPLTPSGITQMVTNLGEKAELDKHVTPHLFRHSAITDMLRHGMNPLLVAQVVGHRGLQMIQRVYSHLTPDDASRALLAVLRAD